VQSLLSFFIVQTYRAISRNVLAGPEFSSRSLVGRLVNTDSPHFEVDVIDLEREQLATTKTTRRREDYERRELLSSGRSDIEFANPLFFLQSPLDL